MSKYTPSFLKNADGTNKFAALSDEFSMGKREERPLVNTSRPAMEAPKMVPATLAALTSKNGSATNGSATNGSATNGSATNGGVKSYASRFAEKNKSHSYDSKIEVKPEINSVVEFPSLGSNTSSSEFPSLGSKSKNIIVSSEDKPVEKKVWASMAKDWAKKKEEEEKAKLEKERLEEERRRETEFIKQFIPVIHRGKYRVEEEYENTPQYDDDSLGSDSEGYEVPENEETTTDGSDGSDVDEGGEVNQGCHWDGRRRDDLY